MPYRIRKGKGARPFKIVKVGGKQVGSSTSRRAAERSIRARNAAAHGAKLGRKRTRK